MAGGAWLLAGTVWHELFRLAMAGILLFGIDDLVFDLAWLKKRLSWRMPDLEDLPRPGSAPRFAIWIPAWDEAAVIGPVLRHMLRAWSFHDNIRVLLGCYPNDTATIAVIQEVAAEDDRVQLVFNARPGPTTKGDNLASLWRATMASEARFDAIILHDAEDIVHRDEIAAFEALHADYDMVQLPVLPFVDRRSRWVAGHYADEFAESHIKDVWLRGRLGAPVPSAGVGTMIALSVLDDLARRHGGLPFAPGSVTEDYEVGMRLAAAGFSSTFARVRGRDGAIIAVRECFPAKIDAAVRQKARWTLGIALAGWDRLTDLPRSTQTLTGQWMRWRDRRSALAALLLAIAYVVLAMGCAGLIAGYFNPALRAAFEPTPEERWIALPCMILLVWRLALRVGFTTVSYGWREGLRALPRSIVGNIIMVAAVRRAIGQYIALWRGGTVAWDKTSHRLPDDLGAPI